MERRFPKWIKFKPPTGARYRTIKKLLEKHQVHTICQEALCPNIGECFERGTATFLILGNFCTRRCGYCNVSTGNPLPVDEKEPERVAEMAEMMQLNHVVITSPSRDDLPDGGSGHFARTIRMLKSRMPHLSVEVLIPDFKGSVKSLCRVLDADPDILNHNVETVPRLYPVVRKQANYEQSLELINNVKQFRPDIVTKSGIIIGLGEEMYEIKELLHDLRDVKCEMMTIGQYLQPSVEHLPVKKYYTPDEFEELRRYGGTLGFLHIESAPHVRSSYHADMHKVSL